MHRVLYVIAIGLCTVVHVAAPAAARTMVRLSGDVPAGISGVRLDSEYARICRLVAPARGCGRSAVRVVFYRESRAPLMAARLPEWGGGGALGPDTAVVPLDKPFALRLDLERIVVHELVHCALLRAARGVDIPRWFHEGVAMTLAGEISFEEQIALARAVFAGRLPSLRSVDSVNMLSAAGAALAYSLSHAAVLFLVRTYGIEVIGALVEAAVENADFHKGVAETLGLLPQELETAIRRGIHARYGPALIFGDYAYVWLLVLAVAVVAFVAVRRRARSRRAAMEREESGRFEPRNACASCMTAPLPSSAPEDLPSLPAPTRQAADVVAEWARTWRLQPEEPTSVLVAAWLYGECLQTDRPKPRLQVALEFDPLENDNDEEATFERLRPLWHDALVEALGELQQAFRAVEIAPCYSDDERFCERLEQEGLLVYERDE